MTASSELRTHRFQEDRLKTLHTPSGIEKLPEGWHWCGLDDVTEGVFDCPHSTPKHVEESNFYSVRTQDILSGKFDLKNCARVSEETYRSRISRAEPRFGDLVYSREGTYFGIAAEVPQNAFVCLGQRMVLIRPERHLIHHSFLRWWLNSPVIANHIRGFYDGSVAERLNLPVIRTLPVALPPLPEQKAIATVLGSLDEKIELLREQNETLEALAQTLFKRWFIDFNFPDENGNPYKDSGGDVDVLEETSLDTFIEFNPIEKIDRQREYLFFDMKCLPINQLSLSIGVFKSASSATSFREGDTLLAKITPCLENGKTGLVQDLKGEDLARGSTEFIVMRAKSNGSKCFNYCLARSSKFRNYAIRSMSGSSGRQRVPVDRVKSYSVINKPELIRYFEALVAPNFKKIKVNAQQIETLCQLRDTLLPKLMKGETRVSLKQCLNPST